MNIILVDPAEISAEDAIVLRGPRARHVRETLRAQVGQDIRIGKLNGPLGSGRVVALAPAEVHLACRWGETPARPVLDLLLALPRPKVMKRLWAPLASLGVRRIILAKTWKVERPYFDTHVLAPAGYLPLLIEGLQQAGDTWLPEVSIHRQFKKLVEDELAALSDAPVRLVLDPAAPAPLVGEPLSSADPLLLAIGPEGGWLPYEVELLEAYGFKAVSMGARVLRSDVACISALAVVDQLRRRAPPPAQA